MNLKLKAALFTVGFVAATTAAAIVTTYALEAITADQVKTAFVIIIAGLLVNTIYNVVLARMEYDENINKISDDLSKITKI